MGNAQRAMETTFCEAPGCPEDAAPEARYCTRHMRRLAGEAASALVDLAPPKETIVDPGPPAVTCRVDGCVQPAAPHTIGARRQGGRYDMCETHLEELTQRTRETRRANREAEERRRADHAASRSPRSHVPVPAVSPEADREEEVGAAGSPAGEGTETAPPQELDWRAEAAARGQLGFGVRNGAGEREWTGDAPLPPIEQEPQPGDVEIPLDRVPLARLCGRHSDHDAHEWIEDDDPRIGMETLYRCDGSGEGSDGDEPEEEALPRMLRPPEGERDFGRAIAVPGILETAIGRYVFGVPNGPQRDLTWAERAQTLVDVGRAIDDLEVELEQARARWRSLASPE